MPRIVPIKTVNLGNRNFREFFRWRGGDFVTSKREFPVALLVGRWGKGSGIRVDARCRLVTVFSSGDLVVANIVRSPIL